MRSSARSITNNAFCIRAVTRLLKAKSNVSQMMLLGLFVVLCAPVQAMDFSIERVDLRPLRPLALRIKAEGPIVAGDTQKLINTFASVDTDGVRDVSINFDSPGGSLMESLKMGNFIGELPAIVSASVGSDENPRAICASACVYAYVSADYRYLSYDAQIGIHRFGLYDSEADGNEGVALGQAVSAVLSEYLRSHRTEPELFETISLIDHDDIYWIPRSELEEWRVVNNNIYDERAEYINVNGKAALRLTQIAITGDSFLTLFCTSSGLSGLADLHEPDLAQYGDFEISLDGEPFPLRQWEIVERKNGRGRVVFDVPAQIALSAMRSRSIGARVVTPGRDLFFGFEQEIRDNKLNELIGGCPARSTHTGPAMIDQFNVDYTGADMTRSGIRDISFAECKQICLEHSGCQAVSYVRRKAWCWPKNAIRRERATNEVISAIKR